RRHTRFKWYWSLDVCASHLLFILDRVTGEPIYGVEERPVPKGDVPGEWYSPTQPFPVKPPPLARLSFKYPDDIAKVTPEHEAARSEERRVGHGACGEGCRGH